MCKCFWQVVLWASVPRLQASNVLRAITSIPWRISQEPSLPLPPEHKAAVHQVVHRKRGIQHWRTALREHHDLSHATHLIRWVWWDPGTAHIHTFFHHHPSALYTCKLWTTAAWLQVGDSQRHNENRVILVYLLVKHNCLGYRQKFKIMLFKISHKVVTQN